MSTNTISIYSHTVSVNKKSQSKLTEIVTAWRFCGQILQNIYGKPLNKNTMGYK